MEHGNECPCPECAIKRRRHEDAVADMGKKCPGCRVSQPYDKSNGYHTETADLYDIKCEALDVRQRIDTEIASGEMLWRHAVMCDCSMCRQPPSHAPQTRASSNSSGDSS